MRRTLFFVMWLALPVRAGQGSPEVSYQLKYDLAQPARIMVTLQAKDVGAGERTFVMPRAIPMGYSNQPYDRFVQNLRALDKDGNQIEVERGDGPRWRVGRAGGHLSRIEYEVDLAAMERQILSGGDSSRARPGYVYLLGYSVFGFLEGEENSSMRVEVTGPPGWPVCSTLSASSACSRGRAEATAKNFYALADSQILLGENFSWEEVKTSQSAPLRVAIYAELDVDRAGIRSASREAYQALLAYFGSAPFPAYTAVFEFVQPVSAEHTYGFSMEHLESATFCLQPERALTPQSGPREVNVFRVNIAHHMAHAWVPKRAYGQGYFPFSWELAPAHDSIWFSEGFGQYAALDALADMQPAAERTAYLDRMLELRYRSTLREMPRFLLEMPLEQLSYRGSYLYSEDFRIGRTLFSRGALMAAEMDARIRARTKNARRMRDAFRYLVAWSIRNQRAFRIEELPGIFQQATGVDTGDILQKWLGPVREGMVPPRPLP